MPTAAWARSGGSTSPAAKRPSSSASPTRLYDASDATADGRSIAVTTNDGTGQLHAILYDVAGKKSRALKPTPWEQTSGAISPDGRTMLVGTGVDGRQNLSLITLATLAERPLPLPPGVNYSTGNQPFSPDGTRLLVTHSGADTPTDLYALDLHTGKAAPLTRLAMASLTPGHLPRSTVVTYKSFDGTLVSAVVTMPFNLRARRQQSRQSSFRMAARPARPPTGSTAGQQRSPAAAMS